MQGSVSCNPVFQQSISHSSKLKQASFAGIISQCDGMQSVFTIIQKVAKTDNTVLVLGESGTGKELIARAPHRLSCRKGKLVPVNCGAIPEEILEGELFGHEKGAFTGATQSKIGRFQLAEGGTIFLDEIGEMSPKLQVKLLRVLQERVVEPVGSTKTIPVNVRIVAATNQDLMQQVKEGKFREDLYYRLQVVPIELPSLRERGADTSLLAKYFLEREAEKLGKEQLVFSSDALDAFSKFAWPGNVRELENLIRRLAVLSDRDEICAKDLPEYVRSNANGVHGAPTSIVELPDTGLDYNQVVGDFESKLILKALERTQWNKKAAATLLKLNRTTLVEKIKKKGLEKFREEMPIVQESKRPSFGFID